MKKIVVLLLSLFITAIHADGLILDNKTSYPMKTPKSKIAIEWAESARQVDSGNQRLMQGSAVNPDTMQRIHQSGKATYTVPANVQYFRVLVWTTGEGNPDLHTNWIDIVPNKTYTLQDDQLVPTILMQGMGC